MNFEIIHRLVDDPLFRYDRKTGMMCFDGGYEERLHTEQVLADFFVTCKSTKLLEEDAATLLKETWEGPLEAGEMVCLEIPMLAVSQKYEMFRIKGIYDKVQDAIVGSMHNIEMELRAVTDSLTGLFNRDGLEQRVPQVLNATQPENWTTLYLLDLDNFKEVNDTRGHLLGDELLKEVADILRKIFFEKAYIGRIGGDEFLVITYGDTDSAKIGERANQMCGAFEEKFAKLSYQVTLSIGVAVAQRPISYQTLFAQADAALYATKSAGKNGYRFFSPDLKNERYTNGRSVGNGMNGAIVQDGSFIQYHHLMNGMADILNKQLTPKDTIVAVSKLVVDTFDVTRAYASCYMPDGSRIGKSYFYAQDGVPNIPPKLQLKRDEYAKNFNEEGILFCTDVTKLNEPIRSELLRMQVDSLLQLLVYDQNNNVIGTVGINHSGEKRLWLQDEIDMMHSIAKLLTGTLLKLQEECIQENDA